jgi:stage II sporulation protein AB (anti-sigma F factor)
MPEQSPAPSWFRLECNSLSENVGLVRLAVAALAGQGPFSVEDVEEIKVAVSEAVTNAIIHGYQGRGDGQVEVVARLDGHRLTVTVRDEGVGIADVEAAMRPGSLDEEHTGLGFAFMTAFMDEVSVNSRVGQGTSVVMEKVARPEANRTATHGG